MEAEQDWSDETIDRRLREAAGRYLPELTSALRSGEIAEAREAYMRAFRMILCDSDPSETFDENLRKAVAEFTALGPEAQRGILRDYRVFSEIASINADVFLTSRRLLRGEEQFTPETKERVAGERRRLSEMRQVIQLECPYLTDNRMPRPPLRVTEARTLLDLISESALDADYILHQGQGHRMSLRLARLFKDRGGR